MRNKVLLLIVVILIPFAVISFSKPKKTNFILPKNRDIKIKVLKNDKTLTLNLEDYIMGVVAGEMPASFEDEALKAQAVVSRTYALYKKKSNRNEYDLTSTTDNQVYITEDEMKYKWGNDFNKYYDKIKKDILTTKNEILTYKGKIIESFYFAMSNGSTQNAEMVFKENKDYLQKVDSKYDNSNLKNFEVTISIDKNEFIQKLNLPCQNIQIDYINYNDSHYVKEVSICNKKYTGVEFRKILNLRSADFTIDLLDNINITTRGYGHGVGLSQYGANGYAKEGLDYKAILKHYYKNVKITKI